MKRWLYSYRTVHGDPGILQRRLRAEIRQLLVQATGGPAVWPAGDGSFPVRLASDVGGAHVTKIVRVRTGVATTVRGRLVIPMRWCADPGAHAFPVFEGAVEFEPMANDRGQLTVVGSYEPPAGPVGLFADATVLHGVAERTADWLIDSLVRALDRPRPEAGPGPSRLLMRVADVMSADPLVLHEDLPLRTAALLLFHMQVGGAPVVDEDGRLVGVLSEADLLEKEAERRFGLGRAVAEAERRREASTVGQACTRPARVTAADTSVHAAAREMLSRDVARLVVVDGGRIAGIVTRHDVLKALIRSDDAIRDAAQEVVQRMEQLDVRLGVECGVVTLRGMVSRLSQVNELTSALEAIDGVTQVDSEGLGWHVDDVIRASPAF